MIFVSGPQKGCIHLYVPHAILLRDTKRRFHVLDPMAGGQYFGKLKSLALEEWADLLSEGF